MAADASAPPAFAFHDRFAAGSPSKQPPASSAAAGSSSSMAASSSAPALDFDFGDFTHFDSSAAFPAFSVAPALSSAKAHVPPPLPPSQPQPSPSVAALEAAVADAEEQETDDAEQARQRAAAVSAAQMPPRPPAMQQQQQQQAQPPAAAASGSNADAFSSANMYASPPRKSARPAPPSGPSNYNNGSPGAGPLPQPPRLHTADSHSSASMYSDAAASPAAAMERMSISSGQRPPSQPQQQPQRQAREPRPDQEERARPSSFFGMEQPTASIDAAGNRQPLSPGALDSARPEMARGDAESAMSRSRPSSFFGVEAPASSSRPGAPAEQPGAQSQAARIAAYHRGEAERSAAAGNGSAAPPAPSGNYSTLAGGTGNGPMPGPPSGRPASIAPTLNSGALLDHSHLRPGQQAALLSHNKTLELYRQNAKKTNDPNLIYELAVFMIDASKTMGGNDAASGGSGGSGSGSGGADGAPGKEESARDELVREAVGLLKKIAERGHPDAQYFLADCYANGIGSPKGKQDFDHAYPLFVLAAKHGHADAAYRAGTCYEKGWGCRKDAGKALQFYRKAAAQSHPGAMYRLATAELNGELGLKKSAREGVKWLKRSAEASTPEFPHALHELALLHERGIDNVVFVDPEYACELLAQAGEMGYAPSAYKLGVNYEYGRMGCPQDAGLSIHMYNIAAQQNHREACFALTAWYLVGAPGILPQSDTEAYLWAKKAAEQGLAKAEYAVGYFTEMGIGTVKDVREARAWYRAAAEHGDKRANQRLAALGARPDPALAGIGATPASVLVNGGHGAALAAQTGGASNAFAAQPPNAPFPGQMGDGAASQMPGPGGSYPTPMAMRTAQTAARQSAYEQNVAAVQAQQQFQQQQQQRGPPRGDPRLSQQPQMRPPPGQQQQPQMRSGSGPQAPQMRSGSGPQPPQMRSGSGQQQPPPHMRPPSMQPAPYAAGPMSPGRGGPPPQQAYPSYPATPTGPPGAAAGAPAAAPPVPDKKKGWFGRA